MTGFSEIEKYAIIKILSQIMKADGIIHPKEEEYMNQVYNEFNIKIKYLEDISNIDDIQANLIINTMCEQNKAYARNLCIKMAEADGYVHTKELDIINRVFG